MSGDIQPEFQFYLINPIRENIRLGYLNQTEEYEVYLNNPVQRLSGSFV